MAIIPEGYRVPLVQIEYQNIFNELNAIVLIFSSHYFDYALILGKSEAIASRNFVYLVVYGASVRFSILGILKIMDRCVAFRKILLYLELSPKLRNSMRSGPVYIEVVFLPFP